jgi:hypothetical protein
MNVKYPDAVICNYGYRNEVHLQHSHAILLQHPLPIICPARTSIGLVAALPETSDSMSSFTRCIPSPPPSLQTHHSPLNTTANMLASRVVARSARAAAPRFQAVSSRGFAEAVKIDAKPPVAVYGVDGTYATALVRNTWAHWNRGKM